MAKLDEFLRSVGGKVAYLEDELVSSEASLSDLQDKYDKLIKAYEDMDKLCSDIFKIVEITNCCDDKTLKVLKARKLMINRGRHI